MNLPTRIKQHKAESDSYAILIYKLRNVGIFRNLTENDYGIDFEIEVVLGEEITGKYIKAQVKSSEKLSIRKKDKVPVVGGIKQSTLLYWAELSFKTNVLAYAVDLKTENIYITKPLFWQATRLLDGTDKSKSIEFVPVDKYHSEIAGAFTYAYACAPIVSDIIHHHQFALRNIKEYIEFYTDIFHYDIHLPTDKPELFRSFLEICKILLWDLKFDKSALSDDEQKYLLSYEFWGKQGSLINDEIPYYILQKPMKVLMPAFINALVRYKKRILDARYYWRHMNRHYLRLVYESAIPETFMSHDQILAWGYDMDKFDSQMASNFYMFLMEIDEEFDK